MTTTVAIGVGNLFRNDDGVGIVVARSLGKKLREQRLPPPDICESSGEGTELISAWEGYDQAYVFDAVMHRGQTGRIYRLEASRDNLPTDFFKYSSHAFSLAEAVEMSRVLDRLPDKLVVFGIEGEDFAFGEALSAGVMAASEKVVDAVIAELQ